MVISLIYFCYSLLILLWLLQLVLWLQVPISGEEEDSNCWPTSPTPQQVQKGMHLKIKELTKLKAPLKRLLQCLPIIKSPPPVLREKPKHTQPSPANELMKLRQVVKKSPHIVQEGMHTLQAHTERNTNLLAVALQMFGACISSWGILESCKVAGIDTGFNDQVVWK